MKSYLKLDRRGANGAPEGSDKNNTFEVPAHSTLFAGTTGKFRARPLWTYATAFDVPPAAALAAGKDPLLISLGTGAEVIARAAKGGVNVKTQASTPADNDNAMLITGADVGMIVPITAVSRPRFSARVSLTQITEVVFGAGMDENKTSPIMSATAGDGAGFVFDPDGENYSVAVANWQLLVKVNGTDATALDSGVPVVAGRDYELEIQVGEDLKPVFFINGVQVGVGAVALTSGDSFGPVIGVQINAAAPSGQKDFDCRYVAVERFIG